MTKRMIVLMFAVTSLVGMADAVPTDLASADATHGAPTDFAAIANPMPGAQLPALPAAPSRPEGVSKKKKDERKERLARLVRTLEDCLANQGAPKGESSPDISEMLANK